MNRATGKRFIASNSKAQNLMNVLHAELLKAKMMNKCGLIDFDVNVSFQFFYPTKYFYTKQGKRSNKVADMSNLYQSIEDGLQKVGILSNDSLICSHNGSFRAAIDSDVHKLKIIITRL
jgi:Holliday junction resolvase RusA-like endonuclease